MSFDRSNSTVTAPGVQFLRYGKTSDNSNIIDLSSGRKISLFMSAKYHKRSVPVAKAAILSTTTMLHQQQQHIQQQQPQPLRKTTPSANQQRIGLYEFFSIII